jgi:hypothetical protein
MADYVFDDWKKVLDDFQNSVSKDLEEIHKQKDAVQQMKTDIFDRLDSGRYITDDQRIVLSAPEIVIGNVDKSGMLKGGGRVIIRGNAIDIEGAGKEGTINHRAPVIRQTAVDPGTDGMEDVVYPHSAIVSQARAITLESNDATDVFSWSPATLGESGIRIHADKTLDVEASMAGDAHKESVENRIDALKEQKDLLKKASDGQKKEIDKFFSDLKKLMDKEDDLNGNAYLIRTNMVEMEQVRDQVQALTPALYGVTKDFIQTVSALAEVNRQITALEAEKKTIKTGEDFRKEPTGASLTLKGESIDIVNHDGDGWLCTNEAAAISIHTPQMGINMDKEDGTLVEDSSFGLNTGHISLSTGNPNKDGSEITAEGDVTILSKNIILESMDFQQKDKIFTEKGLAADGKISIAAKTIEVSAAKPADVERDENGNITKGTYTAEGDILLTAKNISAETVDYEIASGKPKTKAVTEGSKMTLLSETITVGKEGDDFKSKKIDATASEDITLKGEKTFTAQQGDDKASVKLADGKMNLASDANEVKGKTEFNDAVKGTELTMNKVEVKQSFKSMNIKDGM